MKVIKTKEHGQLNKDDLDGFIPKPNQKYLGEPRYLNIDENYKASYFIGATWLSGDTAVVVVPKIENTDFIKLFKSALAVENKTASEYFAKCYGVDTNAPFIETSALLDTLSPLLILHYIHLLKKLLKKGLRKDYITRQENLKTKVKGRVLLSKNLQKNIWQKRDDRVFCAYSEYCADSLENRLLKKALKLAKQNLNKAKLLECSTQINQLLARFEGIGDEIELKEIKHFHSHKIYKEYNDALRVAKMILRRFENVLNENSRDENKIPPFWIDMSRLYELYVYSKLAKSTSSKIEFQKSGYYGKQIADFVIDNMILDAKYKQSYKGSGSNIDDIRELSGNARDETLLSNASTEPRCVIIYPGDTNELSDKTPLCEQGEKILGYRNFYKISVPLPLETNF